jgi:hypothetical protein
VEALQVTRDPALKAEVNRLQGSVTKRLNEWRNDQWNATLESGRPVAVEDDQTGDESSYFVSPPVTPGGVALSDSEKADALGESLETEFQPVTDPSIPGVLRWLTWR